MDIWVQLISALDSTLRLATPLILCAMAGLFSERSGIVDIGLEGKMLAGAFAAAATTAVTGSVWLGLITAMAVSIAMALLHGFACITHKGDQVVSGLAINILAAGLSVALGIAWFHRGGQTPALASEERFRPLSFPFSDVVVDWPIIGTLYSDLLSGHNLLVYLAFLAVPLTYAMVYKTRFGLRLRAVGENPQAVDTAGISVAWLRYRAVIMAGLLCGLAGAYLSIALGAGFVRDMSAGKGYIALAALIFGKWRPVPAMFACLLFGFLEALSTRLQGVDLPIVGQIEVQFMQALPYVLTVILLAGFIGRAVAPKAIGVPYNKDRA
mgnify:FL=1